MVTTGSLALALRTQNMATTLVQMPGTKPVMGPVTVPAREVLRCEHCALMQFRTSNSMCRRCHKPLDVEEMPAPIEVIAPSEIPASTADAGLRVAAQVKEIRKARHLSQRQLAGRMQVPRTYISKIENGKAMPTLSSLARLAAALEIDICHLLRDARSRRHEETASILGDPFLAELAPYIAQMDTLQRSMFLNQVRDLAMGRRRSA
jgi:transcriptional regulator with XRE-family HTH domain